MCQAKEEQLEDAVRLTHSCRGPCPVWKGADDAQASVFLVSYFIYKPYSAVISLQEQNLRTAGRRLRRAGPGEELGAGCFSRASGFAPELTTDPNHLQKLNEAPSPDTRRQDACWSLRYALSARWCILHARARPRFPLSRTFRTPNGWFPSEISHQRKLSTTMTSPSQVC